MNHQKQPPLSRLLTTLKRFFAAQPQPPAAEDSPAEVLLYPPTTPPEDLIQAKPPLYVLPLAVLGLTSFTAAQWWLLVSRRPLLPLVLFPLGLALLLPVFAYYARHQAEWHPKQLSQIRTKTAAQLFTRRRLIAWGIAGVGAAASVWLAGDGVLSVPLALVWLAGVIAAVVAAGGLPTPPRHLRRFWLQRRVEVLGVLALVVTGAIIQVQTPIPAAVLPEHFLHLNFAEETLRAPLPLDYPSGDTGTLYHYLEAGMVSVVGANVDTLRYLSVIFGLLTIPAIYGLARAISKPQTAFFTAGLTTVALWWLALSRSIDAYSALAFVGAVTLHALFAAFRSGRVALFALTGVLMGIGWLLSPLFAFMALLLPIGAALHWLDDRSDAVGQLTRVLTALLVAGMIVLPFAVASGALLPDLGDTSDVPLDPALTTVDALFTSLLMFNLTRDPSPLHGIVNRPALQPLMAAAFLVGVLGWAWRVNRGRQWRDLLLPLALVVGLLPSAVYIAPPVSYPHTFRAAMAFAPALTFAGLGLALVARPLTLRWSRLMRGVVVGVFVYLMFNLAADTYSHYLNTFVPIYQRAVPIYNELAQVPDNLININSR